MGPRKAKQEVKFLKKPIFYSILYTGYKLHQLTCCPSPPPPPKMRRAKAHPDRALRNCDRMHEQTDFSTFSAQKAQKGRYSQKNSIKGERNGLFQKGEKGRTPLGKGYQQHQGTSSSNTSTTDNCSNTRAAAATPAPLTTAATPGQQQQQQQQQHQQQQPDILT